MISVAVQMAGISGSGTRSAGACASQARNRASAGLGHLEAGELAGLLAGALGFAGG